MLNLNWLLADRFKGATQRARVVTEEWGSRHLYCLNCSSNSISQAPNNTAVFDYKCSKCDGFYQLKSQSRPFGQRINDGAYGTMINAIKRSETPNLFLLHYSLISGAVENVTLIPDFAFSLSTITPRQPLASTARRAGWTGCHIVLSHLPPDVRIPIVREGAFAPRSQARRLYAELKSLRGNSETVRGWTLDVLNVVRKLKTDRFTLEQLYGFEDELARLHPNNRHVRDKIRQQLQVLRDLGLLKFLGHGLYEQYRPPLIAD
jgi:type II restriction enzyme